MDAQRSGVPFHGPVISEDFGLSGYVLRTDPVPSIPMITSSLQGLSNSAYSFVLQGSRTWDYLGPCLCSPRVRRPGSPIPLSQGI